MHTGCMVWITSLGLSYWYNDLFPGQISVYICQAIAKCLLIKETWFWQNIIPNNSAMICEIINCMDTISMAQSLIQKEEHPLNTTVNYGWMDLLHFSWADLGQCFHQQY